MPFKFNPISGQFDLVNPAASPGGSDGQIQYNDGGAFGGALAAGYDDVANRMNIGDQTGSYSFFPTNDTKLQITPLINIENQRLEIPSRKTIIPSIISQKLIIGQRNIIAIPTIIKH